MNWTEAIIKFKVKEIEHSFKCISNLPFTFGLSIEDAVNSWVVRTKDYSFNSFRKYVCEKTNYEFYLFSEDEFNDSELMNEILGK